MARARAYKAQVDALGQGPTALVNAVNALAEKGVKFVPEILVAGGNGVMDGLGAELMGLLRGKMGLSAGAGEKAKPAATAKPSAKSQEQIVPPPPQE